MSNLIYLASKGEKWRKIAKQIGPERGQNHKIINHFEIKSTWSLKVVKT
jgi:hypothetical protein